MIQQHQQMSVNEIMLQLSSIYCKKCAASVTYDLSPNDLTRKQYYKKRHAFSPQFRTNNEELSFRVHFLTANLGIRRRSSTRKRPDDCSYFFMIPIISP